MSDVAGAAAIELVTIGEELLLGETVDTNGAWLGRSLAAAGWRVRRRTSVGDDGAAIRAAVAEALERTRTVLCTGGLGPTADDVTKRAVAALFGRELRLDDALLREVQSHFTRRGLAPPESNRTQAEVPEGARILQNRRGTAPGLVLEDEAGRAVVLLPGVPHELRGLIRDQVLDYLRGRLERPAEPILHRVVRTFGLPESEVAERVNPVLASLAPLSVAFLPGPDGVDLRLTSWGDRSEADARLALAEGAERLAERLGAANVYATENQSLADILGEALRQRGLTLATAESCTAGWLGKRLTDRAGASDYFVGGIIAYANAVKSKVLGVSAGTLDTEGAVSETTALEMARGARTACGADVAVSITGIAGPGGGTEAKPVGTVWVAVADARGAVARRHLLHGNRDGVRERATQAALILLRDRLHEPGGGP